MKYHNWQSIHNRSFSRCWARAFFRRTHQELEHLVASSPFDISVKPKWSPISRPRNPFVDASHAIFIGHFEFLPMRITVNYLRSIPQRCGAPLFPFNLMQVSLGIALRANFRHDLHKGSYLPKTILSVTGSQLETLQWRKSFPTVISFSTQLSPLLPKTNISLFSHQLVLLSSW